MTSALVDSVAASVLHKEISSLGVSYVLIVPDTHQKTLLASIDSDPKLKVLTLSTELEAICVNAGMWIGGTEALIIIQNVGLFAAMNALRGVSIDLRVPTCMLVGQFNRDVHVPVEANKNTAVRYMEPVLQTLDVPVYTIDRESDVGLLSEAYAQSRAERRPTVVLVSAPTS